MLILVTRVKVWMHVTETPSKRGFDTLDVYLLLPLEARCRLLRDGMEMWDPSASVFPLCYPLSEAFVPTAWGEASALHAHSKNSRYEVARKGIPCPWKTQPRSPSHFTGQNLAMWPHLAARGSGKCSLYSGKCGNFLRYMLGNLLLYKKRRMDMRGEGNQLPCYGAQ